jgi:hypothetical protein
LSWQARLRFRSPTEFLVDALERVRGAQCAASTTFADRRQLFLPAKGEQRSAAGDRSGTR